MLCNISEDQRLDLHILVSSWYDALELSVYIRLHGHYRCRKQPLSEHQHLSPNSRVIITRRVESLSYIYIYIYPTMLIKYAIYMWAILQAVMMHSRLYPWNPINDLIQWYINYLHFPFHVGYCRQNHISTKAIWTSSLKTWLCSCDASTALIMILSLNVLQKNIWV